MSPGLIVLWEGSVVRSRIVNFGVEIEEKLENFVGDRLESLRKECHQVGAKARGLSVSRMRGSRRRTRRRACRRTWPCSSGS